MADCWFSPRAELARLRVREAELCRWLEVLVAAIAAAAIRAGPRDGDGYDPTHVTESARLIEDLRAVRARIAAEEGCRW